MLDRQYQAMAIKLQMLGGCGGVLQREYNTSFSFALFNLLRVFCVCSLNRQKL